MVINHLEVVDKQQVGRNVFFFCLENPWGNMGKEQQHGGHDLVAKQSDSLELPPGPQDAIVTSMDYSIFKRESL